MALNFNNDTGVDIDFGDIVSARFEELNEWTVLAFFRVENTATDDRAIISTVELIPGLFYI